MAPGQLQDSARTLAWHFGNAITAFCFRSALLKPLPLFRQRSSPAGDRNREANAERTRKKVLVWHAEGSMHLQGAYPDRLLLYLIYIMLQKSIVLYYQLFTAIITQLSD